MALRYRRARWYPSRHGRLLPRFPTRRSSDLGANVDSKPHHLVQFARLGAIYAHDVLRRSNPRVGLLNIGEEPEKGDELAVEAHGDRKSTRLNSSHVKISYAVFCLKKETVGQT